MKKSYKKEILLLIIIVTTVNIYAQDTAAMVKDFNKVMSFTVRPYVHYIAITKMEANPVLQTTDTAEKKGEFYKNGTNLYYNDDNGEMYLEDSIYIQVNHAKKSIWISKVDVASKEKMNLLPLDRKDMQDMFRKKYTISQAVIDATTGKLNFETTRYFDSVSMTAINITLQYNSKTFLPGLLRMDIKMKQALEDEQVQQLKSEIPNSEAVLQKIGDANYLLRTQSVVVSFINIDDSKEKAMQIPLWENKIAYNKEKDEFSGKGAYSEYEITKTF